MSGYNFKNLDFGPRGTRPLTGKSLVVKKMAEELGYDVMDIPTTYLQADFRDTQGFAMKASEAAQAGFSVPATEHSVEVVNGQYFFNEAVRRREEYDRVTDIIQKEFDSKGYHSEGWIHDVSFRATFMTIHCEAARAAEDNKLDWLYKNTPINNSKYATPPSKRNRNHPSQDQSFNARRK